MKSSVAVISGQANYGHAIPLVELVPGYSQQPGRAGWQLRAVKPLLLNNYARLVESHNRFIGGATCTSTRHSTAATYAHSMINSKPVISVCALVMCAREKQQPLPPRIPARHRLGFARSLPLHRYFFQVFPYLVNFLAVSL